jgi:hypothetical protein
MGGAHTNGERRTPMPSDLDREPALSRTLDFLRDLSERGFWGNVSVSFQEGKVIVVRIEEVVKPQHLPGKPKVVQNERFIQT